MNPSLRNEKSDCRYDGTSMVLLWCPLLLSVETKVTALQQLAARIITVAAKLVIVNSHSAPNRVTAKATTILPELSKRIRNPNSLHCDLLLVMFLLSFQPHESNIRTHTHTETERDRESDDVCIICGKIYVGLALEESQTEGQRNKTETQIVRLTDTTTLTSTKRERERDNVFMCMNMCVCLCVHA